MLFQPSTVSAQRATTRVSRHHTMSELTAPVILADILDAEPDTYTPDFEKYPLPDPKDLEHTEL